MKKKHARQEEDADIDMTPMLDIVFIMLIFFIVTTSFVKEKGLEVNRPDDSQKSSANSKSVSILINENGLIYMDNRLVDKERVNANIQRFLAENDTDSAVIKAHPKTKHGIVVEVLDQAAESGLSRLSVVLDN